MLVNTGVYAVPKDVDLYAYAGASGHACGNPCDATNRKALHMLA